MDYFKFAVWMSFLFLLIGINSATICNRLETLEKRQKKQIEILKEIASNTIQLKAEKER